MVTPEQIERAFEILESAGYQCPVAIRTNPEAACETWASILADLDLEGLRAAVLAYARSGAEFWPRPGQLLSLAPGRATEGQDDADEAFGRVLRDVRRHGRQDPPGGTWDFHRQTAKHSRDTPPPSVAPEARDAMHSGLAAIGGWAALCMATDDTMTAHRASFRAAYRTVRARALAGARDRAILTLVEGRVAAARAALPDAGSVG